MRLRRWPDDGCSGSGHARAGAPSVGRPGDPCVSGESTLRGRERLRRIFRADAVALAASRRQADMARPPRRRAETVSALEVSTGRSQGTFSNSLVSVRQALHRVWWSHHGTLLGKQTDRPQHEVPKRSGRAALCCSALTRTGESCQCWPAGGPWSEALRRAAGTRPERFLAASPVPVIRLARNTTGASVRLACVALAIPTRRDAERSEDTRGGRVPASRKRAPGGQCRHGSVVRPPAAPAGGRATSPCRASAYARKNAPPAMRCRCPLRLGSCESRCAISWAAG
jgi:hypothetical protein